MKPAPIALFVYNRPEHTKQTVEALARNRLADESDLYIFSDAPKNDKTRDEVDAVRQYLKTISGFHSTIITERSTNLGLARSIVSGVTELVNKYGRIIVLEDDLVTSPYFLTYMNQALDLYQDVNQVGSIHGYVYPIDKLMPETFFLRGADCWGWATWSRAWKIFEPNGNKLLKQLKERGLTKAFDLDGNYPYTMMLENQIMGINDSWAIRWHASCFLADKYTLYPGQSLVQNIGMDDSGQNSESTSRYDTILAKRPIQITYSEPKEDPKIKSAIADFLAKTGDGRFSIRIKFQLNKVFFYFRRICQKE